MLAHAANWQIDPPLVAITVAAGLYTLGLHKRVSRSRGIGAEVSFFIVGLGVLGLAFSSPLAALDDDLFWVHMIQHVLILAVAPPLILLGRPWSTISRELPLTARRRVARGLARGSWSAPLRVAARRLGSPTSALLLFLGTLVVWHVPTLFDATLHSLAVHELEHALFLAVGLLYWSQLIDSPPFRSRLDSLGRALYAAIGMVAGSALGLVLAFAPSPLYPSYVALASRPGGISALADQHVAGGIMWVPGSIPFAAAFAIFVYRWLEQTARDGRRTASPLVGER